MTYHFRRKDLEITDESVLKKILGLAKYVTIAMCADNQPYLVSLSYGYDGKRNCIYFHCAGEGKKIDILKSNNNVWGQAVIDRGYVKGECNHHYASVHFAGKVAFIEGLEEKGKAVKCMMHHLDENPEPLIARLNLERLNRTTICRIDIEHMTGAKSKKVTV